MSIADVLESAPAVRILIGAEPEAETIPDTLEVDRDNPKRAVERVESAIVASRDEVPFEEVAATEVQRLEDFLRRPTTHVRIYRKRFLHGKAFIFSDEEAVIAGSANFTRAGLNHNLELDLGQYNPDDVRRVREWYNDLWQDAEPYDLADIFKARLLEYEPHLIYLRMLFAQYSAEILIDDDTGAALGSMQLAEFQKIGGQRSSSHLGRMERSHSGRWGRAGQDHHCRGHHPHVCRRAGASCSHRVSCISSRYVAALSRLSKSTGRLL